MTNERKSPGDKERASNGESPEAKKEKPAGKKVAKPKTVPAEIARTAKRETDHPKAATAASKPAAAAAKPEVAKPERLSAKPAPEAATPVSAKPTPNAVKSAGTAAAPKSAPVTAKPASAAAKPAAVAAKSAPVPARPASAAPKPRQPSPLPAPAQHLLGRAVDTFEQSLKAAGQGTLAVNCLLLDFARMNVNSGLDHVKDLAGARSPARVARLQMEYWHDCVETFLGQAQALRALSAELVANTNEPLRKNFLTPPRAA